MDNDELIGLIARCALRDQQALEQLYRRTANYLNAVAFRLLGSRDLSNEVLQEAFIQIWDNAAQYAPSQSSPLTWMVSIVRYRAIDKLRHESRHDNRPPPGEEADILSAIPGAESQEDTHNRFQLNEQMRHCLEAMNDKFKRSVELAYIYGYSREELAEALDANVNTIKSWLRRGSAKLKDCLTDQSGVLSHE